MILHFKTGYKTDKLALVRDPLSDSPELVRIHDPAVKLDHAKLRLWWQDFLRSRWKFIEQTSRNGENNL